MSIRAATATGGAAVDVQALSKHFAGGAAALKDVTLHVPAGDMVALIGASGSGKSTLLRHISGFVAGDAGAGRLSVDGRTIQAAGRIARDVRQLRRDVGFVFQQFNLVGRLTVLTNVLVGLLPRVPAWRSVAMRFTRAETEEALAALASVGIAELAWQRASTLSGGQQQRVAIARALVQHARVILADEPIASLDPESARNVMEILHAVHRERGITVIVSLHQVQFAKAYCPRAVALRQGRVVYDGPSSALGPENLRSLYESAAVELLDGTQHPADDASPAPAVHAGAFSARAAASL